MKSLKESFFTNGFIVLDDLVSYADATLAKKLSEEYSLKGAGSRNLLKENWCQGMAKYLKQHGAISSISWEKHGRCSVHLIPQK